jgi:hypothetical protein
MVTIDRSSDHEDPVKNLQLHSAHCSKGSEKDFANATCQPRNNLMEPCSR